MVILGVTGNREGMTERQLEFTTLFLNALTDHRYLSLHHGDCVGADEQAHDMFMRSARIHHRSVAVVVHPPTKPDYRAWKTGDEVYVLPEADYLVRNRHIVDACDFLLVFPRPDGVYPSEGGTGYTWKYAIRQHKPHLVVPA